MKELALIIVVFILTSCGGRSICKYVIHYVDRNDTCVVTARGKFTVESERGSNYLVATGFPEQEAFVSTTAPIEIISIIPLKDK